MQIQDNAVDVQQLELAYVEDAHNVGCLVRLVGTTTAERAHYSAAIQQNGVVIRSCHVVVVDRRSTPLEVIWRIGTIATVETIGAGEVTLDLGYRRLTSPYQDERPEPERSSPLAVGDRVFLRGSLGERATITDTVTDGELRHPDALRAQLERVARQARRES
jgi:hypothetical protein